MKTSKIQVTAILLASCLTTVAFPAVMPTFSMIASAEDTTISEDIILEKDTVYSGNLTLTSGIIDLNGYSLTVKGDFTEKGGIVNVDTGTLIIKGDYKLQYKGEESEICILNMAENSIVDVDGSVTFNTRNAGEQLGTLRIGGDLTVKTPNGYCGYNANITEFRGNKSHEISFESEMVQLNTLKLGIGDSVTFTDYINGISEEAAISLKNAAIASVSGTAITAKKAGETTLFFSFTNDDAEEQPEPLSANLIIADSNTAVAGDVNDDGVFSLADIILLKKWLMHQSGAYLYKWENADLNHDKKINIYDLCLMKKLLLK